MSVNSVKSQLLPLTGDIEKGGCLCTKYYKCKARLVSYFKRHPQILEVFLTVVNVFNISAGIGMITFICLITFCGTHWKIHSSARKAVRITVASLHYIILPITSMIMMWVVYYKKKETTDQKVCCVQSISKYACNWSIICEIDGVKQVETPSINADFKKLVGQNNHDPTVNNIESDDGSDRQNNRDPTVHNNQSYVGPDRLKKQANTSTTPERKCCTLGRCVLILLNIFVPVLYSVSGGFGIGAAGRELKNDTHRQPTEDFTSKDIMFAQGYSGFTIGFYFLNLFLTIPALVYAINTYRNAMYKSVSLEQSLRKSANFAELKEVNACILKFFQSPGEILERKLFWVNIFSSVYIVDVIIFAGGYILYLFSHDFTGDWVRWIIIATLGTSGFLLLLIIVATNHYIQGLKRSTLLISSIMQVSNSGQRSPATTEDSEESSALYNVACLQTILDHFNPYATVCGYAPYSTALLAMVLTQVVTLIVPWILREHGIIKPENPTPSHLNMF